MECERDCRAVCERDSRVECERNCRAECERDSPVECERNCRAECERDGMPGRVRERDCRVEAAEGPICTVGRNFPEQEWVLFSKNVVVAQSKSHTRDQDDNLL